MKYFYMRYCLVSFVFLIQNNILLHINFSTCERRAHIFTSIYNGNERIVLLMFFLNKKSAQILASSCELHY